MRGCRRAGGRFQFPLSQGHENKSAQDSNNKCVQPYVSLFCWWCIAQSTAVHRLCNVAAALSQEQGQLFSSLDLPSVCRITAAGCPATLPVSSQRKKSRQYWWRQGLQ